MLLIKGQAVTVNGNSEAIILRYDNTLNMYEIRLWSGGRHVGDVVKPANEIKAN